MVSYILFPVTFTAALWMALEGLERGVQTDLLLAGISAGVMLIVAIFERVHPEHSEWNVSQDDVGTDLMHGLVSMVVLPQVLELGLRLGLLHVALWISTRTGLELWPHHWSPLLQLAPALLISQLGEYWAHRAMHEVPFMWRFHATHHSPGRLYWLNAGRFHPVDSALLFSVALTPLLLVGAGPEVLTLFTVWVSVH
ncbi:MAG: sterol desaturase family protein, partial [Myxococcota bacterium]|nr:sterol desaturase family protein [Myxococcota bacterium]